MRYRFVVIGRSSRGPFEAAIARYLQRLRALAGEAALVELREARARSGQARRAAESAALGAAVLGRGVVLDECGRSWTTSGLAGHVQRLEAGGVSRLSLLVGGAAGTSERLRAEAAETWSLSPLTLSHELALVVALEQLYRVEAVRTGHPYHRS